MRDRRVRRPPRTELKELRRTRLAGCTLAEVAEALGCTRHHMANIEAGRRDPSLKLALSWLALLGDDVKLDVFGPCAAVDEAQEAARRLRHVPALNLEAAF